MDAKQDMRDTLAAAAREAGCSDADFSLVSLHEYRSVLERIVARFCKRGRDVLDAAWLWEHLVEPREAMQTDRALQCLATLLPPRERVWFIAEDWPRTKRHGNYWLYETTVAVALRVLGEAHAFEYYIVKRDLAWLVCESHHGVLIGVGDEVVDALRALKTG